MPFEELTARREAMFNRFVRISAYSTAVIALVLLILVGWVL